MYGDQQAQMTMNRAAYGDVPAAMMAGGNFYGGAAAGMSNMMSDLGQSVFPITYTPPARFHAGYYGMYRQHTGLMRGLAGMVGFESVPRGTSAMEYAYSSAGDVGERFGSFTAGAAATVGSLAAGYAMAPMGGAIGRAALGGVGGFLGSAILPYMAASAVTDQVMTAVNQRREIQSFLEQGSFRFSTAGGDMADPRLGGGMSRSARRETSEFIRQMDIRDPMMNTEDLTQIMKQGTQLGLFNGARDMQEFQSKFKDITEAVKGVTRVLHQTLEEGMKTIKDLKGIGIDPSQAKSIVSQADFLGKMAGRTGAEMLGVGLQGAEMFRGTGVTMGIGAQASMMNLASIRAARDAGLLSQEAIVQAGGEEALAMRQTASGLAYGQSAFGRGASAAFFSGGGFNQQSFMSNMMAGGGNFVGQAAQAAGNLSSPAALIAYQANQEKFMSEMGAAFGGRGLQMAQTASAASYASYMAGATGAKFEDAFKLTLKQQGLSMAEIDTRLAEIRGASDNFRTGQSAVQATLGKAALDEAHNNFVFTRLSATVGDKMKSIVDTVARPINKYIDDMGESFQNFKMEQMYGMQTVTTKGVDLSLRMGGTAASTGAINLDKGGIMAQTAGSALFRALTDDGGALARDLGLAGKIRNVTRGQLTDDMIVLRDHAMGGMEVVRKADMEAAQRKANIMGMTEGQAKSLQEAGALRGVTGGLMAAIAGDRLGSIKDYSSLAHAMFGTADLTSEQQAKLILETKGTAYESMVSKARDGAGRLTNATSAAKLAQLKDAREMLDAAKGRIEKAAGMELATGVVERLALADQVKDPKEAQRLRSEALNIELHTGVDPLKAKEALTRVQSSGELKKVAGAVTALQNIQSDRGSTMLSQAVEAQLYTQGGEKLTENQREKVATVGAILGKASNVHDFVSVLKSEDAKDLQKLSVGQAIKKQADTFAAIESFASGDTEGFQAMLKKKGISDPQKLGQLTQVYAKQGSSAAAQAAFKSFQQDIAGPGGAFSAGGAGVDKGGTAPTAQQEAALQTNINLQTLAAMQAIAGKLGVR